jgi:hypothetical protein
MEQTWLQGGHGESGCEQTRPDLAIDLEVLDRAAKWSRIMATAHPDPARRVLAQRSAERFELRARALRQ